MAASQSRGVCVCGGGHMSRRQVASERSSRGGARSGARGERPSKRSAVHARRGTSARNRSSAPARPLLMAMKRAMRKLALRDCSQRCVYCASPLDTHNATLDHVMPLARGGAHDPENIVAACGPCNRLKGDLLPQEFFARFPWAGQNFIHYARSVHRALKRVARRAVSLACANSEGELRRGRDGRERLAA